MLYSNLTANRATVLATHILGQSIGGGLDNGGMAKLKSCVVAENRATGYFGALGGGVSNAGSFMMSRCRLTHNSVVADINAQGGGLSNTGGVKAGG